MIMETLSVSVCVNGLNLFLSSCNLGVISEMDRRVTQYTNCPRKKTGDVTGREQEVKQAQHIILSFFSGMAGLSFLHRTTG